MKRAKDMVGEAKAKVENLDPAAVAEELERGAVLVDLRDEPELAANGRIPGSVHIPRGMLEFRADPTSLISTAASRPGRSRVIRSSRSEARARQPCRSPMWPGALAASTRSTNAAHFIFFALRTA